MRAGQTGMARREGGGEAQRRQQQSPKLGGAPAPSPRGVDVGASQRLTNERRGGDAQTGRALDRDQRQIGQDVDHGRLRGSQAGHDDEGDHQAQLQQALLGAHRPADGRHPGHTRRSRAGPPKARNRRQPHRHCDLDSETGEGGHGQGQSRAASSQRRHGTNSEDQDGGESDLQRGGQ